MQLVSTTTPGTLTQDIAHEIRNPLSAVYSYTDLIKTLIEKNFNIPEDIRVKVRRYCESLQTSSQLIEDILCGANTRSSYSQDRGLPKGFLALLVNEAILIVRPYLDEKDVSLTVYGSDSPIALQACPASLVQVLINLLRNSIEAVFQLDERWIDIEITARGNKLKLAVTDSGHGLPKSVATRVFEPFFTSKGSTGGKGLGLAISRQMVSCCGGTLDYDASSERTRFVITLPRSKQNGMSLVAAAPSRDKVLSFG